MSVRIRCISLLWFLVCQNRADSGIQWLYWARQYDCAALDSEQDCITDRLCECGWCTFQSSEEEFSNETDSGVCVPLYSYDWRHQRVWPNVSNTQVCPAPHNTTQATLYVSVDACTRAFLGEYIQFVVVAITCLCGLVCFVSLLQCALAYVCGRAEQTLWPVATLPIWIELRTGTENEEEEELLDTEAFIESLNA